MIDGLIVDSFAGGGGASLGIKWAVGRCPDIAINHDAEAIAMHEANHPSTNHVLEDVWKTDLRRLVGRRKVGLLWASPDCKHFSRAKGGKPVEKRIRSLAWIVCKWADQVRPAVICLENVREFADWGPLVPLWQCRDCGWRGTEGQATLMRVRRKCPTCESRRLMVTEQLVPCQKRKGVTFKRFVGRLKNLGYEVQWRNLDAADYGAPTHRRRLFLVARRDGNPIEWPEPTHARADKTDSMSLFRTLEPYRTAAECIDWSIPCPSIFDRKRPLVEKTLRRIALGIKRYVLESSKPFIVPIGYGERTGQSPRTEDVNEPLGTVVGSAKHAVVVPVISRYNVSAFLAKHFGGMVGVEAESPLPTTTAKGCQTQIVSAFLAKHCFGQVGIDVDTPLPTTTMRGTQTQIVAANLIHMNHGGKQWSSVEDPMRTATTGKHAALVYSFLVKYFGTAIGANLWEPAPTATSKDRCGLVTVTVDGQLYVIVDIGMRMLTPRELARAQGFPDDYVLTGTNTSQVARIGNSVCPQMAQVIVGANCLAPVGGA